LNKNLILCGFMGCGKSTVGHLLADRLGMTFLDLDSYLEREAAMSVSDIFASEGEDGFRRREHDACVTLGRREGLVLATGGGAVLRDDNVEALKQNGVLVWLSVSPLTVVARLKDDTSRPLLQREDKDEAIRALLEARAPLYTRAADLTVGADGNPDDTADAVIEALTANGLL